MNVQQIFLEKGKPVRIIASLSVEEAAKITVMTGRGAAGDQTAGEIYECLTGELFNRYRTLQAEVTDHDVCPGS